MTGQYPARVGITNFLVGFSEDKDFIYSSRMMGSGFGGCTINLIEENSISDFVAEVTEVCQEKFGIQLETIIVVPEEGTVIL